MKGSSQKPQNQMKVLSSLCATLFSRTGYRRQDNRQQAGLSRDEAGGAAKNVLAEAQIAAITRWHVRTSADP